MATVIRLQRGGRKKRPFYNIVVLDSRKRRDGAFIEKLGYFDPCKSPEVIELDQERAKHWMATGAQVSPRVVSLIRQAEAGPETAEKKKSAAEAEVTAESATEEAAAEATDTGDAGNEAGEDPATPEKAAARKEEDKAES